MQRGRFFIIGYNGSKSQMYQMKLAEIIMLIIMQIYRKRKRYILRTALFSFNIHFQRSKNGFTCGEKI